MIFFIVNKLQNFYRNEPSLRVLLFILLAIQILVGLVVLTPFLINYDLTVYKNIMDGPGYINFDFTNLKIILDQQRTFGAPLIIKVYSLFDKELTNWPNFILSFILFQFNAFYSLIKINFSKIFLFYLFVVLFVAIPFTLLQPIYPNYWVYRL